MASDYNKFILNKQQTGKQEGFEPLWMPDFKSTTRSRMKVALYGDVAFLRIMVDFNYLIIYNRLDDNSQQEENQCRPFT